MKECSVKMETSVSEIQIETKDEKRPEAASPQKERQERKTATLCFKRRKKANKKKAKAGSKTAEETKKHAPEAGGSGQRQPAGAWASIKRLVTHRNRSESAKKQKPSEAEMQPEDGALPKKTKSKLKIPCIRFSRGAKRSRPSKLTEDSGYVRVQGEADDLEIKAQIQPDEQATQAKSTQGLQEDVMARDGKEVRESHISNSVISGEHVIAIELELEKESSALRMRTPGSEKEAKVIPEKQSVQAQQASVLENSAADSPQPVTSTAPLSPATTHQRGLEEPSDSIRESAPSGKDDRRRKTAAEEKKSGETALGQAEEASSVSQADKSALSQAEEATVIQAQSQAKEGKLSQAEEATVAQAKETVLSQAEEVKLNQTEEPAISQAKKATVGQAKDAMVSQAEEATVGHTEKATMGQAEEAIVGQAEEATVGHTEKATMGQAEKATVGHIEKTTVGQAEEATVGQAEEATVGQAEEATVGQAGEATVSHIEKTTVGQAEEAIIAQAEEATVGQAEEATVGQAEEATVGQAEEATVGQAEEATVGQAEEATVGQAEEATVGQAEEATVGQAEEATVGQAEEATVGQAEEATVGQAEEPIVGQAEETVLRHAPDLKENGVDAEKPRSEESKRMEPIAIIITDTEISEFDVKKSKNVPKQFLISMENEQVGVFANDSDFEGRTSEQYETLLIETASSLVKNAIELSVEQLVNEMVSEDNQINTLFQ
ncbi:A-kinase anchor protein 5 isoform X3 [Rattus rattus]|uniref:A-kinase anchor protein 5 isoform X2 n=1 Tax=Rattus rattus TaxID=10117 RepID=UPI0013F2C59B|nr:A-kinase anchor protein 5 isoform X2 [Rattus rattus]XP_032763848.1 A-kinase anchor protein 5 isoform X3 [Rattus rattus]